MSVLVWRGDAKGVAQVTTVQFPDIEIDDVFNLAVNRKTVSVTATATDAPTLIGRFVLAITTARTTMPEWGEVTATASGDYLLLTGPIDGKPFTVTGTTGDAGNLAVNVVEVTEGYAGLNEKQRITIPGTATGGTCTLSFDGQGPTAIVAYNATAATVETALEALSNIDTSPDDIAVTGSAGGPWEVEFLTQYANVDVALLTGDGTNIIKGASDYPVIVDTVTEADPGLNEIQEIWFPGTPSGGTFTLTWQGDTTSAIAYGASAATIQTALETGIAAITAGDVSVTAGVQAGHWTVEYLVTYRNTDVDLIEGSGASLTGNSSVLVLETTKGSPLTDDIQRIASSFYNAYHLTLTDPLTGASETVRSFSGEDDYNTFSNRFQNFSFVGPDDVVITGSGAANAYPFTIQFVGRFAGLAVPLMTGEGIFSSPDPTITHIQIGGLAAVNEVQRVELVGGPTGGTFTLTFRGQTTAIVAYNATAATVKAALDAISTIGTVTVTGSDGGPWTVTFGGTEGGEDVPLMTGSAASLTGGSVNVITIQTSMPPINEVQTVSLFGSPRGGTFTLTYDGVATGALTYDESAADVETALDGLAGINDCSVAGADGGPWTVTYQGTQIGVDVQALTGDGSLLSGADILVEVTQGSAIPINEIETITLGGSPDGGTYTLTYSAQTTGAILYNASSEAVRIALESLSNIDIGEVTVAGGVGGPWTVTFIGGLGATDVTDLTGDASNLTSAGTQSITVTATTTPTGPNWVSEANNWHNPAAPTTATAPADGDTIWAYDNDVDMLYGLEYLTGATLAAAHFMASYTGKIGLDSHNGSYYEYRPLNLAVGIIALFIGEGEGSGSGRLRFDLESILSTIEVYRTGMAGGDLPAFIFKGGHANTVMTVFRGKAGVAMAVPGDTANLLTLNIGYVNSVNTDSFVEIGAGCTAITTVTKSGGVLRADGVNITTLIQENGLVTLEGDGTVGTLIVDGGSCFYNSSGTCTAGEVAGGALLDFRQSQKARTFTDLTIHSDASVLDPHGTLAVTNPIQLVRRDLNDGELDFGTHISLVIAAGA